MSSTINNSDVTIEDLESYFGITAYRTLKSMSVATLDDLTRITFEEFIDRFHRVRLRREADLQLIADKLHELDIGFCDENYSCELTFENKRVCELFNPFRTKLIVAHDKCDSENRCEFYPICHGFHSACVKHYADTMLDLAGERESDIIRKLCGIGCESKALIEISDDYSVMELRIKQIVEKGYRHINSIAKKEKKALIRLLGEKYKYHPYDLMCREYFGSYKDCTLQSDRSLIYDNILCFPVRNIGLAEQTTNDLLENKILYLEDINSLDKESLSKLKEQTVVELLFLLEINGFRITDCPTSKYPSIGDYLSLVFSSTNFEYPDFFKSYKNSLIKQTERINLTETQCIEEIGFCFRVLSREDDSIEIWIDNKSNSLLDPDDIEINDCYVQLYEHEKTAQQDISIVEPIKSLSSNILPNRSRLILKYYINSEFEIEEKDTLTIATEDGLYFEYRYINSEKWQLFSFYNA